MTQNDAIIQRIDEIKASVDFIPTQAAAAKAAVSSGSAGGYTESLIQEAITVVEGKIQEYSGLGIDTNSLVYDIFPQYGAVERGHIGDLPDTTDPLAARMWKELTVPGIYDLDFEFGDAYIKVREPSAEEKVLTYWLVIRQRPTHGNNQSITVNLKRRTGGSYTLQPVVMQPGVTIEDVSGNLQKSGGNYILKIETINDQGNISIDYSTNAQTGVAGHPLGIMDQLVDVELGDLPTFGTRTRHLKIGDGAENDIIMSCGTISGGSNSGAFINTSPSFFYNQNNIFTFVSNVPATANKESGVIISTDYQNEMIVGNQSTEVETATLQLAFAPNRAISFQNNDKAYVVVGEDSGATTGEEMNLQMLEYNNGGTLVNVSTYMAHNVIELLHFTKGNEQYVIRVESSGPSVSTGFARLMIFDRSLNDLRVIASSSLGTNPIGASLIRAMGEVYLAIWGEGASDARLYRLSSTNLFNEVTTLPAYFRGLKEFCVISYDENGLPSIVAIRKADMHAVLFKFETISSTLTTMANSIRYDYAPGTSGIPAGFEAKELAKLDGNDGSIIIIATQRAKGERGDYGKVTTVTSSATNINMGESTVLADYTNIESFQIEGFSYVSGVIPSSSPSTNGTVKVAIHHTGNVFNEVLSITVQDPVSATFETINTRHYLFVSQGNGTVRTFELVLGQFGFGWASFALPDVASAPV